MNSRHETPGPLERLQAIDDKMIDLAGDLSAPLPFKQDNLDKIRGNFAEVVLLVHDVVGIMMEQQSQIEKLAQAVAENGKAAAKAVSDAADSRMAASLSRM